MSHLTLPGQEEEAWKPRCSMCTRETCTVGEAFVPTDDARQCSDTFTPKPGIGVWVISTTEQPFYFVTIKGTVYVSTIGSQNLMLFRLQDWHQRRVKSNLKEMGLSPENITDILTKLSIYSKKSSKSKTTESNQTEITIPNSDMSIDHENTVFVPEASDGYFEHKTGFYIRRRNEWIISELTHLRGTEYIKDKKDKNKVIGSHTTIKPILYYNNTGNRGFFDPRDKVMEFDGKSIFLEGTVELASTLHTLMSFETAQRFLNGEAIDIRTVYPRLIEKIRGFVDCSWDERMYDLIACIAIATHFFDIYTAFPIIFIYGPPETGKGRVGKCITYAGHRGIQVVDPTSPTFYRMMDALRPTLFFDELTMAWEGFQMHWRSSYKKGAVVPRMDKKDEVFALRFFEEYGPTIACSTTPIMGKEKEATESRFIFIHMRKTDDPNPEQKDPEEIDFEDIRNDLYICRLTQARNVEIMSEYLTAQRPLSGRDWELWRPVLTVAAIVSQDVLNNVSSYAKEHVLTKRGEQYKKEKDVIKGIKVLMSNRELIRFTPKELSNSMYNFLKEDFGHKVFEDTVMARQNEMDTMKRFNKVYSYWHLGHILKRMDLKPVGILRGKQYSLTKDQVVDLSRRFGVPIT